MASAIDTWDSPKAASSTPPERPSSTGPTAVTPNGLSLVIRHFSGTFADPEAVCLELDARGRLDGRLLGQARHGR